MLTHIPKCCHTLYKVYLLGSGIQMGHGINTLKKIEQQKIALQNPWHQKIQSEQLATKAIHLIAFHLTFLGCYLTIMSEKIDFITFMGFHWLIYRISCTALEKIHLSYLRSHLVVVQFLRVSSIVLALAFIHKISYSMGITLLFSHLFFYSHLHYSKIVWNWDSIEQCCPRLYRLFHSLLLFSN